jgi:hypothetical protein
LIFRSTDGCIFGEVHGDDFMWSFLSAALSAIPSAATSHLALTAYALAVFAYIVTIWRITRNRNLLHNLQRLPAKDRLSALEIEMGGVRLAAGISPEQWLQSKIHRYYFLSFVITCLVAIVVFFAAIVNSHGTLDISVDLYQKSSRELAKPGSLLAAILSAASMSKGNAAEAEFVDPSAVPRNKMGPRTIQQDVRSDTTLRYSYQKTHDQIIITPILGYADKQRNGETVYGFRWWHEPFEWEFPALSVKIANNTNRDVFLSEAIINVKDSIEDNRPIIVVEGPSYDGEAYLQNEGWGPVFNPVVKLDVGCEAFDDVRSVPNTLFLPTFSEGISFSIKRYVSDSMIDKLKVCKKEISSVCFEGVGCIFAPPSELGNTQCLDERPRDVCSLLSKQVDEKVLEKLSNYMLMNRSDKTRRAVTYQRECSETRVCVGGLLEYTGSTGENKTVQFRTTVVLESPGAGAPAPPSYRYDVFLEPGKKGYMQRKSIYQAIKPGEVDHFLLRIATSRSANFKFSLDIMDAGGSIAWNGNFDMSVLVPRSGARRVLEKIGR